MAPPFMSLPPELRNMVYDSLWNTAGVIQTRLSGTLMVVHYNCVEPAESSHNSGLPHWLLTSKSFLFEALDLLRLNFMWVLHRDVRDKPLVPEALLLLDPDKSIYNMYTTKAPIKILRILFSHVWTGKRNALNEVVPEWYTLTNLASWKFKATAKVFQFDTLNGMGGGVISLSGRRGTL